MKKIAKKKEIKEIQAGRSVFSILTIMSLLVSSYVPATFALAEGVVEDNTVIEIATISEDKNDNQTNDDQNDENVDDADNEDSDTPEDDEGDQNEDEENESGPEPKSEPESEPKIQNFVQKSSLLIIKTPENHAPVVSIGNGNGNSNNGPDHLSDVSGTFDIWATVQDEDGIGGENGLDSYHFRIVKDGESYSHSCGSALGNPENQGFGGCGYVYNKVKKINNIGQAPNNWILLSFDSENQLEEDTVYHLILGAVDMAGVRTHSDWTQDPFVTIRVNNIPDEVGDDDDDDDDDDSEYPYGIINLPLESSQHSTSTMIELDADYFDGDDANDDAVQWAVRKGTCSPSTNTVWGNVDGHNDPFTWDGTNFNAMIDPTGAEVGEYCFVFNPTDDGPVDVRETRLFEIVAPEIPVGDDDDDDDDDDEETPELITSNEDNNFSRSSSRRRSLGRVLGVNSGSVLGTTFCAPYLNDYLKLGGTNNPLEVTKLQSFLNEEMGLELAINGIYDQATFDAVVAFQEKYADKILNPWQAIGQLPADSKGTGYTYKTTKWWINMLKCEDANFAMPQLP